MLLGKYKIKVEEKNFIKVINILKNRNIDITNVLIKKEYAFFEIDECNIKMLRQVFKKQKIKYKVIGIRGIYFLFEYLLKHWVFTLFFLITIFTIFLSTCFIWNVEVLGEKFIKEKDILDFLIEQNIEPGNLKFGINTEDLNNELRLRFSNIAFSTVDIKGTNIILKIIDYDETLNYKEDIAASDIIASKDAIIQNIVVSNGIQRVKKDLFVKKGTLLIEGKIIEFKDTENENYKNIRARGKVIGKTSYDLTAKKELKKKIKYFTGRKHIEIIYDNYKSIFKYNDKYEEYDVITKEYNINSKRFTINIYEEYITKFEDVDIEEAKQLIAEEVKKQIDNQTEKVYYIHDVSEKYFVLNDILHLNKKIIIFEDVGLEVKKN